MRQFAAAVWSEIHRPNPHDHIPPGREAADISVRKARGRRVSDIRTAP